MRTIQEIEKKIAALVEEVRLGELMADVITSEKELLKDLGLDSLDYASVMLSCEKWLQIKIIEKNVNWREIKTVRQLSELLFKSQNK